MKLSLLSACLFLIFVSHCKKRTQQASSRLQASVSISNCLLSQLNVKADELLETDITAFDKMVSIDRENSQGDLYETVIELSSDKKSIKNLLVYSLYHGTTNLHASEVLLADLAVGSKHVILSDDGSIMLQIPKAVVFKNLDNRPTLNLLKDVDFSNGLEISEKNRASLFKSLLNERSSVGQTAQYLIDGLNTVSGEGSKFKITKITIEATLDNETSYPDITFEIGSTQET